MVPASLQALLGQLQAMLIDRQDRSRPTDQKRYHLQAGGGGGNS